MGGSLALFVIPSLVVPTELTQLTQLIFVKSLRIFPIMHFPPAIVEYNIRGTIAEL
jgi:hypothetical protein